MLRCYFGAHRPQVPPTLLLPPTTVSKDHLDDKMHYLKAGVRMDVFVSLSMVTQTIRPALSSLPHRHQATTLSARIGASLLQHSSDMCHMCDTSQHRRYNQ
jgi:hypothetical protein